MKKFIVSGIITATVMVVAGVIFYACNKEKGEISTKQENVKIQKFDPNDPIVHGVDITELIAQPYFRNYALACVDFIDETIDFTQDEIDRLNELVELMQYALSIGNMDLFWQYHDEFMRVFYRKNDPNYGKERLNHFHGVAVEFMGQMAENYPHFRELSEFQQSEVLTEAITKSHKQATGQSPGEIYCGEAKFRSEISATQSYGIAVAACALTTGWSVVGFGICSAVATGIYAKDIYGINKEYDKCMAAAQKPPSKP